MSSSPFYDRDEDHEDSDLQDLHDHPIHSLGSDYEERMMMSGSMDDNDLYVMYETDEEKACEDVRRMAAAMAPQVQELEDVLRDMLPVEHINRHDSPSKNPSSYYSDDDDEDGTHWDDDFDNELQRLATSEQMLREELEFAQNFSSLMGGGGGGGAYSPSPFTTSSREDPPVRKNEPEQVLSSPSLHPPVTPKLLVSNKQDPPPQQRRVQQDPPPPSTTTPMPSTSTPSSSWTPFSSSKKKPPPAQTTPGGTLYSLQDHAEYLQLKTERIGGWYYCDMTKYLLGPAYNASVAAYHTSTDFIISRQVQEYDTPSSNDSSPSERVSDPARVLHDATTVGLVKDYCIPLPIRKLKRLYCGIVHHHAMTDAKNSNHKINHSMTTPQKQLGLSPGTPISPLTPTTPTTPATPANGSAMRHQTPVQRTSRTMTTTPGQQQQDEEQQQQQQQQPEEPLPVRTVAIRIRPDVLCGTVMGAVSAALEALSATTSQKSLTTHVILKRQGGHLRGAVAMERTLPEGLESSGRSGTGNPKKSTTNTATTTKTITMAYVVDAQLCCLKCDSLERRLLLRMYHIQDDPEAHTELGQQMFMVQQNRRQEQKEANEKRRQQQDQETTNDAIVSSEADLSLLLENDEDNVALFGLNRDGNKPANQHLKQSCSLIQRLMFSQQQQQQQQQSASKNGGGGEKNNGHDTNWVGFKDMAFGNREGMQAAIGKHLETSFKPCPSVREENKKGARAAIKRLTLPSLSTKDWLLLQECWTLCRQLFEELDNRDCTYNTLSTLRFGQFPCLTTLDVQYCSQLRRLSRESMISQLLSSAKELEDYAKSAEYNCANLLTLLDPMIQYYGVPRLDLPTPKPLEEYPLDFVPPQVSCPPWGHKVMEALNHVAAHTTTANQAGTTFPPPSLLGSPSLLAPKTLALPFLDATQAVRMVYVAFMKQDDEEHGARLGRKNVQVMERLSNMQSHQRAVLHSLRDAHLVSPLAARAADDFLAKAQRANNNGKPGHPRILHQQVPILTFRFSVGASLSGTCCITSTQIMFQTSYIPLVGGFTTTLLDLGQVTFQLHENVPSSLLNMYPNTMTVLVDEEPVYSFRPSSLGPTRLLNFLTVLKGYQEEDAAFGGRRRAVHSEFSQPNNILDTEAEDLDVARLASTESGSADPLPF